MHELNFALHGLVGFDLHGKTPAFSARSKLAAWPRKSCAGSGCDTKALIKALKSGRLGGVALDVYEEEEGVLFEDLSGQILQDDALARLLTFPNVLITAHQAFLTQEALAEIARVTTANLAGLRQWPALPRGDGANVAELPPHTRHLYGWFKSSDRCCVAVQLSKRMRGQPAKKYRLETNLSTCGKF